MAEYQCYRLRERIKNHLSGATDELKSEFMFKIDNTWFRINVSAQKQEEKKEPEKPKHQGQPTTAFVYSHPDSEAAEDITEAEAAAGEAIATMIDNEEPNEEYTAMP